MPNQRNALFKGERTRSHARNENHQRMQTLLQSPCEALDVAVTLSNCRSRHRCLSPACAVCSRKFRRRFVKQAWQALQEFPTIFLVTLLPKAMFLAPDALAGVDIRKLKNSVTQQFRRAGLEEAVVIGGVEAVWNPELRLVSVHLHLLVVNAKEDQIRSLNRFYKEKRALKIQRIRPGKAALKKAFRTTQKRGEGGPELLTRILRIQDETKRKVLSYQFKNTTYYRDEFKRPRRPPAEIEAFLLKFLDRHRFTELIFLKGLRFKGHTLVFLPGRIRTLDG